MLMQNSLNPHPITNPSSFFFDNFMTTNPASKLATISSASVGLPGLFMDPSASLGGGLASVPKGILSF